ncbi:hypothetical protein [Planococcus sp. YIM B11945]|uniref:hypothetical protein n=1 Tax=Planococcus sp. YIM B11945 TaxID=3435410 RepID=UPI003D7D2EAF
MYTIETYIARPKTQIETQFNYYSEKLFLEYPEFCYISIKNKDEIIDLLNKESITPEYLNMAIVIKNNKIIVGYENKGLNLWDNFVDLLVSLIEKESSETMLGIEPRIIKLVKKGNNKLECTIYHEYELESKQLFILEHKEFINSLIISGNDFYSKLLEYNFPNKVHLEENLARLKDIADKI